MNRPLFDGLFLLENQLSVLVERKPSAFLVAVQLCMAITAHQFEVVEVQRHTWVCNILRRDVRLVVDDDARPVYPFGQASVA